MPNGALELDTLTEAQRRVAAQKGAVPVLRPGHDETLVFLYREMPWGTYRWLVNGSGRVLQSTAFRYRV